MKRNPQTIRIGCVGTAIVLITAALLVTAVLVGWTRATLITLIIALTILWLEQIGTWALK